MIRDSLFSIQVEQPWLLLQFGNSNTEEIGADRGEALVSASPEDEDGKTREEVVKTEIEDNDNNNLTIPQVCLLYTSFYQSGELIKHREDDREYMGRTLYLGSLKSDVYFCIYEKDYEQYVKLGTPLEEADIINRFEIRLRNERAYYAVRDLLTYYDAEQTAFSIINHYVRFVDEEPHKRKNDLILNDRWAWFIGDNRQSLKLTTKPEPYTLDRTLRLVQRQVAPTLKMLKKIDKGNGTDYMETIEQQAKLTEKHEMIIKQQTTPAKDLVES